MPTKFTIPAGQGSFLLDVTECYCPGDRFSLWLEGRPLGVTSGRCKVEPECRHRLEEFQECWESGRYCHGRWLLHGTAQEQVVEMRVVTSPYTAGAGAVRLQSACMDKQGGRVACCELGKKCGGECLNIVNWT